MRAVRVQLRDPKFEEQSQPTATEVDISSNENRFMVKRVPALDTKWAFPEKLVSLTEISVSRIYDSMTGAALGDRVFWESSHTWD